MSTFDRVGLLSALIACAGGCSSAPEPVSPAEPARRPNIILLLADDLGWGDVGVYGSEAIRTPHLDRLAAEGMRWTQFYAASAVCSPTRASILTGRYPLRFGFTKHGGAMLKVGIPDRTATLPRLLRQAGYATAHVGKWHVGKENMRELGFDRYVRVHYPRAKLGGDESLHYVDGAKYMKRDDGPAAPSDRFMTEALVDEALTLIDEYAADERPFFLNLWFYAPHTPYNRAPEPYARPYEGLAEGDDLEYRSMVTCMDAGVGRILARLAELGLDDDTLLVFTSDNGPSYQGSPGPWTGGKGDLHEGGIRMPMIARWPGRIEPGTVTDEPGHTNDLLPTLLEAAGAELPPDVAFDGVSLVPRLEGRPLAGRDLFWQMDLYPWYPQPGDKPQPLATEVMRRGDWKLMAMNGVPTGLFDLRSDPRESTNRIEQEPDRRDEMASALRSWLDEARRRPPR